MLLHNTELIVITRRSRSSLIFTQNGLKKLLLSLMMTKNIVLSFLLGERRSQFRVSGSLIHFLGFLFDVLGDVENDGSHPALSPAPGHVDPALHPADSFIHSEIIYCMLITYSSCNRMFLWTNEV